MSEARRVRARVEGSVQGVGFRPFVYRLARELELGGFVLNDERGVVVEAEGEPAAVERLVERLATDAPPLAVVERVAAEAVAARGERTFAIVASEHGGEPRALVSVDSATCDACLAELFDPADRRYRYPFVNCTNCGPRFTIVRGVPYDRPLTTMAGFEMCALCRAEYEDPLDRRFHAEPNACPACGPQARIVGAPEDDDPVRAAGAALLAGRVVAVKGLGGFHLACRADDESAVSVLRGRKHREDKPFALMAPELEAARALIELDEEQEALLRSHRRPIVIAPRRAGAAVAAGVAPRSGDLGVMLPYSPLHHLLLSDAATTLVMTSGNVSDEPIAYRDEEALERLGPIADVFLLHDRPIHMRTDDSLVRTVRRRRPLLMRRSRGYVPESIDLPLEAPSALLACGAELKSTFCVAKGRRAWLGHHIGDLRTWETLRSFREGIGHFERLFAVAPAVVAHDLHPDYLSTRYALEREGVETVAVQHHHAHLAACLAEHGVQGGAVGAIFDGTGLGTDGTVWGGELLAGDLESFERAGHLWPVRLPGGDAAVREPWRMACAWLQESRGEAGGVPATLARDVDPARWEAIARMARTGTAAPVTTSVGRLFDAVAALCGLRAAVNYEGQAAAELEGAADEAERGAYELPIAEHRGSLAAGAERAPLAGADRPSLILDARPAIAAIARDVERGVPVAAISARFHTGLARATAQACVLAAEARGVDVVVLSGGAFQNRLLLERTAKAIERADLRVLVPERLPPNDGGISYGQAAVAAARLAASRGRNRFNPIG